MKKVKLGIFGTGKIAEVMAMTVTRMEGVELAAVASRTLTKAEQFCSEFDRVKPYGSYQELAKDPGVDLIYIATPHSEHCANVKLCLNNGKHVLCEKAFAVNQKEAQEMIGLAREKNLLLTEAMWVKFMPMVTTLKEVIHSGIIGEAKTLTANLGYLISHNQRITDPLLAGGALLDVGVYTLTFASIAFGNEVEKITSSVIKMGTGVDGQNSITLIYPDGKMAVLNSSCYSLSDRQGVIYGTAGFIIVENINNFEAIRVYNQSRELVAEYLQPEQISGYEYEVQACTEAIQNGLIECDQMPHQDTVEIMGMMDELRSQWGIKYPME